MLCALCLSGFARVSELKDISPNPSCVIVLDIGENVLVHRRALWAGEAVANAKKSSTGSDTLCARPNRLCSQRYLCPAARFCGLWTRAFTQLRLRAPEQGLRSFVKSPARESLADEQRSTSASECAARPV